MRFSHISVGTLFALAPFAGRAQDTTTATPRGAERAQALEPVAISERAPRKMDYAARRTSTATKTSTPLHDVPQAVTVVTSALIKDQAMQGMADVVRYVPGITMGQGEGNRDQPTIRGNGTTADFFVDGTRDDVQYFRDLYNAERVEALKGSNAMVFGRGGGGGVINRVTKSAGWAPVRDVTLQGGSFNDRRASVDVGGGLNATLAARLNGVYENSDAYRRGVNLERYGLNPTLAYAPGDRTNVAVGYELFSDRRTADRGVPSFGGRPVDTDASTFFGDPNDSHVRARVNAGTATVSHVFGTGLTVRNHARLSDYDKFYQNVYPGAVAEAGDQVAISAYNNATRRHNVFNQTDVTYGVATGSVRHTLLAGAELGRQVSENLRMTGYFNGDQAVTSVTAPLSDPTINAPVAFSNRASDANNRVRAATSSVYLQDQAALASWLQVIAGVRYENFNLRYINQHDSSALRRRDEMISPRAGVVLKPAEPVSLYANYSVSYLPSSGDQFSSLTDVTQGLKPEQFKNYELGAKWELAERLSLNAAAYRLDRSNTRAPHPTDNTITVQTGRQRTNGYELGVAGSITDAWEIAGGYAVQQARIVSRTSAGAPGATVPLVPHATVSLWNRYNVTPLLGLGLGVVHQGESYAAIDNAVTLPGYTRVDGGVYFTLRQNVKAQVFLENVFDKKYFATANSNNNITPGSPRALRVTLSTGL